jgi:hypothetical protein
LRALDDVAHQLLDGPLTPIGFLTLVVIALRHKATTRPQRLPRRLIKDLDVDRDLETPSRGDLLIGIGAVCDGNVGVVADDPSPDDGVGAGLSD